MSGRRKLLLVCAWFLAGCNAPERFLVEGNRAYAHGDRQAAATAYTQALGHAQTRSSACLNLGRLYLEGKDFQAAKTYLDQGLAGRPDYAMGYVYRARAELALGQRPEAAKDLEKAIALEPGAREAWLELARLRVAEDRPEEALEALDQVRDAPSYRAEATFLSLQLHRQLGHGDAAIPELEALLAAQPYLARPYSELAVLHMERKDFQEAERRLRQGLKLEPGNRQTRLALGQCLEALGQWQQASAEYQSVIQGAKQPDDPLAVSARQALANGPPGAKAAPSGPPK